MLFFRSEERVEQRCGERGYTKGAVLSMTQLWDLSVVWYSRRLDPNVPRPSPQEVAGIFSDLGLVGPFWSVPGLD